MGNLIATVYKERTLGHGSLPTVALEEQVQAIEEATALHQQIESAFSENERATPMVSALEDLAFVCDRIKEITPKEAAMIQIAGDMAVAGTDASGDSVTPALESMIGDVKVVGSDVARRIKETIAQIIAAIKQLAKQVIQHATTYISRIAVIAGGSETRLKKLEAAFAALDNNHVKKEALTVSVMLPTVNGKGVSTMSELLDEAQKFEAVMGNFMDVAGDANYNYGSGFVRLYESDLSKGKKDDNAVGINHADQAVKLMQQISSAFEVRNLFRGQSFTATSTNDGSAIGSTTQLLGGVKIQAEHLVDSTFTGITLNSSASVRELISRVAKKSSISVINDAVSTAATVEVEAMTYKEIERAINVVKHLLGYYSARSGSRSISAAVQKRSAFARNCSDQISTAVRNMDSTNPVAYVMSLEALGVTDAITKNATLPYTRLSEAAGRVIAYLLTAVSKSIAAHARSQVGEPTSKAKDFKP